MWVEILLEAIAIRRASFGNSSINYLARQQWNFGAIHPLEQRRVTAQAASPAPLYI
jgi:hypothetical protein